MPPPRVANAAGLRTARRHTGIFGPLVICRAACLLLLLLCAGQSRASTAPANTCTIEHFNDQLDTYNQQRDRVVTDNQNSVVATLHTLYATLHEQCENTDAQLITILKTRSPDRLGPGRRRDEGRRVLAAKLLGSAYPPRPTLDAFLSVLESKNFQDTAVQNAVAQALRSTVPDAVVDPLLDIAAESANPLSLRQHAIETLKFANPKKYPDIMPVVISILESEDSDDDRVRIRVLEALAPTITSDDTNAKARLRTALLTYMENAFGHDDKSAILAAGALYHLGFPEDAVPRVIDKVIDPDNPRRVNYDDRVNAVYSLLETFANDQSLIALKHPQRRQNEYVDELVAALEKRDNIGLIAGDPAHPIPQIIQQFDQLLAVELLGKLITVDPRFFHTVGRPAVTTDLTREPPDIPAEQKAIIASTLSEDTASLLRLSKQPEELSIADLFSVERTLVPAFLAESWAGQQPSAHAPTDASASYDETPATKDTLKTAWKDIACFDGECFSGRILDRFWSSPAALPSVFVLAAFVAWLLLFTIWPAQLIGAEVALGMLPDVNALPWLAPLVKLIRSVPAVFYHPRVLDAWLGRHIDFIDASFSNSSLAKSRPTYAPVPLSFERMADSHPRRPGRNENGVGKTALPITSVDDLRNRVRAILRAKKPRLALIGESGLGKTTLAIAVARMAIARDKEQSLAEHPILPVILDQDFEAKQALDETSFRALLTAKVEAMGGASLSPELVAALVRTKRLGLIIDGYSEMPRDARDALRDITIDFSDPMCLITARALDIRASLTLSTITLHRIAGADSANFMRAHYRDITGTDLAPGDPHRIMIDRVAARVGRTAIVPRLLVRYVELLAGGTADTDASEALRNGPSISRICFEYVDDLVRRIESDAPPSWQIKQDLKIIGWECMRSQGVPSVAYRRDVVAAMRGDDAQARLDYLDTRLKIVATTSDSDDRVALRLDILCVHLAAANFIRLCSLGDTGWLDMLEAIRRSPASRAVRSDFVDVLLEVVRAELPPGRLRERVLRELTWLADESGSGVDARRASKNGRVEAVRGEQTESPVRSSS